MRIPLFLSLLICGVFAAVIEVGASESGPSPIRSIRGQAPLPPQVTLDTFEGTLHFDRLLAPNETDERRAFELNLRLVEGRVLAASGRAPGYNHSTHSIEVLTWAADDASAKGSLRVTIVPDRWVPADRQNRIIDVELTLSAPAAEAEAKARMALGTFTGTWHESDGSTRALSGSVKGALEPPKLPERWSSGTPDGDGIRFDFHLGTKRVNWNHFRCAIMQFESVLDLSTYSGLEVGLRSAQPRRDASVSIWLREEDGSWYYLRSAVPLIDEVNSARLRFTDFAEAEWLAPQGNHMDEDYVLDLTRISHIAIGVVNPLGIGQVAFTLDRLDLIPRGSPSPPPAQVHITGATLSVNEHQVIPAALFGGYAGFLPQKYRPGTQRNLAAPTYPQVPRQSFAQFGSESFTDWPAMLAALRGESEGSAALSKHLLSLIDDPRLQSRLSSLDVKNYRKSQLSRKRDPDQVPGDLINFLNRLLRHRELYHAELWQDRELPPDARALLARHQGAEEINDTERMELNRRLLEAVFPMIHPNPAHGPHEIYYINCFGERKNVAHLLIRADWQGFFASYGRELAENSKRVGAPVVWEFWNEPYLHWGAKDRVNLKTKYFDQSQAVEGGPVQVRYSDGSLGPVIPHFVWRTNAQGELQVEDDSAFTYWSGSGNGWIYDQMLAAAASAIKEHNPAITVVAGWGFRWNEDHWDAWRLLYRNTIDRNIDWIDGLHEHHYQGDTTAMPGSYEVATAYGMTRHGKWLYSYNTETNDLIDAPARGAVAEPATARAATEYRRMVYNLRDLIYAAAVVPDKHIARTVIHPQNTPAATEVCYGLLANLRGRLIEAESDDPSVWAVASIDGTDPLALPPDFTGQQDYVAVVFNDHREARTIDLVLQAPTGTHFGDGAYEQTFVDKETYDIGRTRTEITAAGESRLSLQMTLPERTAWRIALPLTGSIVTEHEVQRKQFFSAELLRYVHRGEAFATTVSLDPALLAQTQRAWLRVVVEDLQEGAGHVMVGERRLDLPRAYTADNVCRIIELPVEVEALGPETAIIFRVNDGNFASYHVPMTSLVLETRSRPRP